MSEGVHRLKLPPCPTCGKNIDSASSLFYNERPQAGDVLVCFDCAEPLIFTDPGLRAATPEERKEIMAEPETRLTIAAIQHDIRERQRTRH